MLERGEREEAIQCLQTLVTDNDKLTACLQSQQKALKKQQRENEELKRKLNDIMSKFSVHFYVCNLIGIKISRKLVFLILVRSNRHSSRKS